MRPCLSIAVPVVLGLAVAPQAVAQPNVKLRPETNRAFDAYARSVEQKSETRLSGDAVLQWIEITESERSAVLAGKIVTKRVSNGDADVPGGLIHDWLGVMFVPGVTAGEIVDVIQDIDNHAAYFSEVLESRMVSRDGDTIHSFLRLKKQKILTVVLNTEHETRYRELSDGHWYLHSRSTKIAQVKNAGSPDERELPVGEDSGFLWRLNAYWNLAESDGGTWVEIRTLSLSRRIPSLLAPLIRPLVSSVPRESLEATLQGTRNAVVQ